MCSLVSVSVFSGFSARQPDHHQASPKESRLGCQLRVEAANIDIGL